MDAYMYITYIYKTESLCCTPETEKIVNQLYSNKGLKKEKNLKKNGYTYNWTTLLYTWTEHTIVNQLYSSWNGKKKTTKPFGCAM